MIRARMRMAIAKLRALWRRRQADEELAREIATHLALLEEEFERSGTSPEEARRAARHRIGGVEQAAQAHRDERSILWLEQVRQDIRQALRAFFRKPGFTAVAVATLAIGIGVNTTLFTAYDAVALKPLPVANPSRVVRLDAWNCSASRPRLHAAGIRGRRSCGRDQRGNGPLLLARRGSDWASL